MNVPTMTVGKGEMTEQEKLQAEVKELRAMCRDYENRLDKARESEERAYMRGRIEGLEFAIRCNGVSGDEVR